MKKLSIILPIYKVEAYIKECLESIFRQGLNDEDFEVILVNDGTPDNSIGVVKDIIGEHQNISLKVNMCILWILMICWLIMLYLYF